MRPKENYTPHLSAAFALTLTILVSFQAYVFREPARIAADEARDRLALVSDGKALFVMYCTVCHGPAGEGAIGPALNDRALLDQTGDDTLFSVISSGVPNTQMPAWNQAHGGPFTDQQVRQLVAYLRAWQPTAPDRRAEVRPADPVRGQVIFSSTCFICHGANGQGTDRAPALNDPARLAQLGDDWYAATIAAGRPAQGMPTWGTVLSPQDIRNLVALLRAWQRGESIPASTPSP
jgi:cytochrome c oxidase cbb3-type subunit 3